MRRIGWWGAIFAATCIQAASATSPASPPFPSADHALAAAIKATDRATKGSQGFALDERRGIPVLRRQWEAARRLAIALLDRQPAIGPAPLEKALKRAGLSNVIVERVDADALLIGTEAGPLGTFSLIARGTDGHFRVALALDALPAGAPAQLAAWRPDRTVAGCRAGADHDFGTTCGPMTITDARRLPPEADGTRRFSLLGRYVKEAGATDSYQLSLWRWDGQRATPLLVRDFAQMAEESIFVSSTAQQLRLHVKGDFKSFTACGSCSGRQMEWRFAFPAKGANPPAVRSLTPDLDAVDAIYDRLLHGRRADDLASPAVVAALTPIARDVRDRARAEHTDAWLGLLGTWKVTPMPVGAADLCFSTDSVDPQIFHIETRDGRRYLTAVRAAGPQACEGPGARS